METLQIKVSEYINVKDLIIQIFESVREFVEWINGLFQTVVLSQEERSPKEGRSPPTLGIHVTEVVKTMDKPPGSK